MTVEITVKCDGLRCCESREIEHDTERHIERLGWGIDPRTGFHYCKKCWPIVQKEIEQGED